MVKKQLAKLGFTVKDKITGFEGIVTSVNFDLYGCIQLLVHPGLDEKGKIREAQWFDTARLEILNEEPIMKQPKFNFKKSIPKAEKGPALKPGFASNPLPY